MDFYFFMKYSPIVFLLVFSFSFSLFAQNQEQVLLDFEKSIEAAVVNTDISFLESAYADDFKFKHGTGQRSTKESWLKDVTNNKGKFISRKVDASEAELHDNIGITEGKITVTRADRSYTIHYVRVYRKKVNAWELFMHRTVEETHNK
ncbi:MAG: nuclear transport factor 2 family protein [Cytophagales bacterium]|nr:nuclear transport factor 2 family protein [Cytophagales bacterium]